jgi:hypothetical protein
MSDMRYINTGPIYTFFQILAAITGLLILIPIILVIWLSTKVASVPSSVGIRIPVRNWLYEGMSLVFDFDLMHRFRNDIFHRIQPQLKFEEDVDRWWVTREMELSVQRTDRALESGEYVLAGMLAVVGIVFPPTEYGVYSSVIFALVTIFLSTLILVRAVAIDVLAFQPESHQHEPTQELAARMAFNRGPLSRGSSMGILLLTLLVGVTGERGYEEGLELVEWAAERSHPDDGKRWYVG